MDLGARIKQFRKQNGMEQKDLAKLLNISPKTVSSWEVNRTQPKMEFISQMCEIFNCRKSDFLEENDRVFELELENLNDLDRVLIESYHQADDLDRQMVDRILKIPRLQKYVSLLNKHYPPKQ